MSKPTVSAGQFHSETFSLGLQVATILLCAHRTSSPLACGRGERELFGVSYTDTRPVVPALHSCDLV